MYSLSLLFQVGSGNSWNQEHLHRNDMNTEWQTARCLLSAVFQHHLHLRRHPVLRQHPHRGRPRLNRYSHSLSSARRRDGAESMTCLCATAVRTATSKRLGAWSLSWRLHPVALGAFCGRGMTAREVQFPQSYARLCRTATYGLCSSLLTSCRMSGASMWCTRFWPRGLCPNGLFPCFITCPALSILRNWSSTSTPTWAGTLTEVMLSSSRPCSCVSNGNSCVLWARFIDINQTWSYCL